MQPNRPTSPSSSGFSFMKMISPKPGKIIIFPEQPKQSDTPPTKKSALEAYAKKTTKQSLPVGFADQILEYEMELELEFVPIDIVNELTDLYTQAMVFYQPENNHKYKFFVKKLEELVLRPNVKETMLRQISPLKTTFDHTQMRRIHLENKLSMVNTEKEAYTLVQSQENKDRENNRVLECDLNSQKDRIRKRLAEKKAKSQSRAQSVTCISDENSSTTEESQRELERDLDDLSRPVPRNRLNEIEEVDEARYNTPPRRRNKDGLMVFYQQGRKSLKPIQFEDIKMDGKPVTKGHTRRHSFHKEQVLDPVVPRRGRLGRAQSFGEKVPLPGLEKLRLMASNSENIKEEKENNEQKEEAHTETHGGLEKKEAEKPKSNNTVEEADEEGSRNELIGSNNEVTEVQKVEGKVLNVEENQEKLAEEVNMESVNELKEEVEGIEFQKSLIEVDKEEKEAKGPSVIISEMDHNVEEHVHDADVKIVSSLITEEILVEAVQEDKEQTNNEPIEETEVTLDKKEEDVEEERQEKLISETEGTKDELIADTENQEKHEVDADIVEQKEYEQEEKAQVEFETEEQDKEVSNTVNVNENNEEEIKVREEEEQQIEKSQEAHVKTNEQSDVIEEAKAEETCESQVENKETNQVNNTEVQEEETVEEEHNNKAQENVDNKEEALETNVTEDKSESQQTRINRRRTDSEVADQERLKLLRQVEDEQKELLAKFLEKQAINREETFKGIEEKYEKKTQALEDDTDPEERVGAIWQKMISKIAKDKETELEGALERINQENALELEKYKKKLQQQKMFKLAQIS